MQSAWLSACEPKPERRQLSGKGRDGGLLIIIARKSRLEGSSSQSVSAQHLGQAWYQPSAQQLALGHAQGLGS